MSPIEFARRRRATARPEGLADGEALAVADRLQASSPWRDRFRADVLHGLAQPTRVLSSVYFYDAIGSRLFEQIMRLPEYYLTRVEQGILNEKADDIADLLEADSVCVVDLGAGSGEKSSCLIERLRARGIDTAYAPIDVSQAALQMASSIVGGRFPTLTIQAVQGDYIDGLAQVRASLPGRRLLVLWLGSSIGNLTDADAADSLKSMIQACARDDVFLLGFDLVKDPNVLVAAYADSRGITAEFNFNLLRRINRELGGTFDTHRFIHHATYNPSAMRMESYLVSREPQTVTVAGQRFAFAAWEPMRTEISCKYTQARIDQVLADAGLSILAHLSDARAQFADVVCQPVGEH